MIADWQTRGVDAGRRVIVSRLPQCGPPPARSRWSTTFRDRRRRIRTESCRRLTRSSPPGGPAVRFS